jgi:predicted RNase H-like nuclease (RuvC/YqgF family)
MKIEVSNGEIVDKMTILELKLDKIKDKSQLDNIEREWTVLNDCVMALYQIFGNKSLYEQVDQLSEINSQLWDVEDWIRDCEKEQRFDKEFVELARSVYKLNDQRSEVKKQINILTKSFLIEEKSYSK